MVTKAIFIITLSLTTLFGMTSSVQSEAEQASPGCITHELVNFSPTGGFTDLIITRTGVIVQTKDGCGILAVNLISNTGDSYTNITSEPVEQVIIPWEEISHIGDYGIAVLGNRGCYDYHQISVNIQ